MHDKAQRVARPVQTRLQNLAVTGINVYTIPNFAAVSRIAHEEYLVVFVTVEHLVGVGADNISSFNILREMPIHDPKNDDLRKRAYKSEGLLEQSSPNFYHMQRFHRWC